MKLSREDQLLKESLLNEVVDNIATLQGNAKSFIDGKEQSSISLIGESINDLRELEKLYKEVY